MEHLVYSMHKTSAKVMEYRVWKEQACQPLQLRLNFCQSKGSKVMDVSRLECPLVRDLRRARLMDVFHERRCYLKLPDDFS